MAVDHLDAWPEIVRTDCVAMLHEGGRVLDVVRFVIVGRVQLEQAVTGFRDQMHARLLEIDPDWPGKGNGLDGRSS